MKTFDPSLYFITDSTGFTEEEFLRRTEEALKGGATLVQIREKDKSTREYLALASKVHELTKKYNVTKAPTMFVTDKAGNTIKLENISDIKKYIKEVFP